MKINSFKKVLTSPGAYDTMNIVKKELKKMTISERLNSLTNEYKEAVKEYNTLTGFEKKWFGMSLVDVEYEIADLSKKLKLYGDKELLN